MDSFFVAIFLTLSSDLHRAQDGREGALRGSHSSHSVSVLWPLCLRSLLGWIGLTDGKLASLITTVYGRGGPAGRSRRQPGPDEGWAFIGTAVTIAMAVATYFIVLFPNVMPSTNQAYNLTIENASSTDYTLKVMTIVALIFTPIVLIYQGWTYWVFRKRLTTLVIPDDATLEPAAADWHPRRHPPRGHHVKPFDPRLLRAVPAARRPVAALGALGVAAGIATIATASRSRRSSSPWSTVRR